MDALSKLNRALEKIETRTTDASSVWRALFLGPSVQLRRILAKVT